MGNRVVLVAGLGGLVLGEQLENEVDVLLSCGVPEGAMLEAFHSVKAAHGGTDLSLDTLSVLQRAVGVVRADHQMDGHLIDRVEPG